MLRLIETNEGERKEVVKGTLKEVVEHLRKNEEIYKWVQDEDKEIELPCLKNIETTRELEVELKKVDLSWWELAIEEM